MESLFLLSTPSQAFFLSHSPELVKSSILIITAKKQEEVQGILDQVEDLNWKKIHVWFVRKGNNKTDHFNLLNIRFKLLMFRLKYTSFHKIYMGSYKNIIHLSLVGEYENSCKVFLLYDGLQMISVNAERNKGDGGNIREFPRLYAQLGFKRPRIKELHYISPVSLQISGKDTVELIKDTSTNLDKIYQKNLIYFIGQPLSIIHLVTPEFYLESLEKFKKSYRGYNIIYFPHPREDRNILAKVAEIFEIQFIDVVFEKYFLTSNTFSELIASFYSSVLVNLIYFKATSRIVALEIPEEEILFYRENILTIYDYFHKISTPNFEVIKIENLGVENAV